MSWLRVSKAENGAAAPVAADASMPATKTARLASAGLATVIIFLAGFSIWGAHTSSVSAHKVKGTIEVRRAFDNVGEAVAAEESLERKYRLEPNAASRSAFNAAVASFTKSIQRVDEIGSARDRRDAAVLSAENGYYLQSTVGLFAAVDRGDKRAALRIDHTQTDPTFARVQAEAQAITNRHRAVAVVELRALARREHSLVFATVGVFALGLILLALFERLRRMRAKTFLETVSELKSAKLAEALRVTKEQLRESQKLEAVGRLAGGVAHDFNNLLTVIGGYAELALSGADVPASTRDELTEIRAAAAQAQTVTAQLLAFSGRQAMTPYVLDLNSIVEQNASMLRRLIGANIDMTTALDGDAGYVEVDPTQIGQVLVNLTLNARDAMPDGGALTLHTGSEHLGDVEARRLGLPPATYATVSLADTGGGIAAEDHAQIFEPFFTTKERGEGTGLGLATAYGIVSQSGGRLAFTSEVGKGTTFTIYLPQRAQPAPADASDAPALAGVAGESDSDTILVIEDEAAVRRLVVRMLRERGYTVLHASDGEQAIDVVQACPGRIDLVLSDVVMPGMAGPAAVARIRELRPTIRRLYMSGYTEEAATTRGALDADAPLLEKPFSVDALLHAVAEALGANGRHRAVA